MTTPSKRLPLGPILLASIAALVFGCSPQETRELKPFAAETRVGETSQGLTCLNIVRGLAGNVEDANIVTDPTDPSRANTNYGIATQLNTGQVGTGLRRAILRFDLSAIPGGAVVTSATLGLQKSSGVGGGIIDIHRITTAWSESTVTYNTLGGAWDPTVVTSFDPAAIANGSPVSIDLTSLAGSWVSGALPNEGIVLEQPPTGRTFFGSEEAGAVNPRPKLSVCYAPASCGDGIQNGAETGVDCGGPCAPCNACVGVVCAPLDQCHVAGVCNPGTGVCSNPAAPNHTPCDDGNACTQADICLAGACVGTNPVVCSASDQCHAAGTCDPSTGACDNPDAADGTSCDDGDACTQTDTCQTGACAGANPVVCAAADQCHPAGTCDSSTGTCDNPAAADGTSCDDGDGCTQTDTCQAGACVGTNPVVCTASDQCHAAGTCDSSTGACDNPAIADGTACDDGNACTQTDGCQAGACSGSNPVVCSASDQCHAAGTCDSSTGACDNPAAADGTSCDDGDACTQTDTCQAGACSGSNPVVCSASDQCHAAGTCDSSTGTCDNPAAADGTSCDDGDACTQTDTCQAGACSGSNPVVCSASDQCHAAGTCDSSTGTCDNPSAADGTSCNDGDVCTTGDVCAAGVCGGGAASCSATPTYIGSVVSMDTVSHGGGFSPQANEYWYPQWAGSTIYRYNSAYQALGTFTNPGDPQIMQLWGDADGSYYTATWGYQTIQKISGINGSLVWSYNFGTTASGVTADATYVYAMDSGSATVTVLNKSNGAYVTQWSLSGGTITTMYGAIATSGGKFYRGNYTGLVDVYDLASHGWIASFQAATNIYNMAFTGTNYCVSANSSSVYCYAACTGAGGGGGALSCDDGNACTDDSCDSVTGCINLPNAVSCDDGNACTTTDTCSAGTCVGSNPVICSASDACHAAGTCDPATGACDNPSVADGTSCDDGNACTQTDTCQSGTCSGGNAVVCSASDQCHAAGTCDSSTGSCDNPAVADGTSCDDGDGSTSNDVCTSGTCAGTTGGGGGTATCTASPTYLGSVVTMDTRSHGGGFSPQANEYWYPEWAGNTIYRYNSSYQLLGTFTNPGDPQIMQLWGEADGSYYTATWSYQTIQKISGVGGSVVWSYNLGSTASGVTADATYVYAMNYYDSTVVVLNKSSGAYVTQWSLSGGTITTMYGAIAVADGKLYRGNYTGVVDVYDLASHGLIGSFQTTGNIYNMSFSGTDYCVSANSSSVYCYVACTLSGGGGAATCTEAPTYVGSVITMDTVSHGGGFSPQANEYWYPQWAGNTVYRYNSSYQSVGTFSNPGNGQIMQLWGEVDGSYYTANWGYNTIQKISGMGGSLVWSYNLGTTASGVTADASYVYAMDPSTATVTVLDKSNGAYVTQWSLSGGTITTMYGAIAVAGDKFYRGNYTGVVDVYDLASHVWLASFQTTGNIYNMAFTGADYCVSANSTSVYCYVACTIGGGGAASCTASPSYIGSVVSMDTRSHGGGFSPQADEYWYPEWAGNTVYRYNASYQLLGTFTNPGDPQIMQLWGEADGSYYTATWSYQTIQKISGVGGSVVWSYNLGSTASGVTADATYVYAMNYYDSTVVVLDKSTGAYVTQWSLSGGTITTMYGAIAVADGKFYRGNYTGVVDVYDLASHGLIGSFQAAGNIYNMSFSGTNYCVSANSSSVYCYAICTAGAGGGGGGGGSVQSFTYTDGPGDSVASNGLYTYFAGLSPSASDFILFDISGSSSLDGAWCADNADFYVTSYLNMYSGGSVTSGGWAKYYRDEGGAWSTAVTTGYSEIYGTSCDGNAYSWCSSWGLGGKYLGTMPGQASAGESYAQGWSADAGWVVTIKVGSDRLSTCGF